MNFIFTPNHVQLLNSCYPPAAALLTCGPDYSPNSQELSRLTYYASNHPEKLAKLGNELEKRVRTECRKARNGNTRIRASLLITLSILRSLATECRRDISLISPFLIASVEVTLGTIPNDLEVISRAASVLTAWTTFTDGHLIGTDSDLTKNYLSTLRRLASLGSSTAKDAENRNRTRLIGFAALTNALNSEALYNDFVQFRAQVSIIMRPIILTILESNLNVLQQQAEGVRNAPISPYLAEFRTRPVMERRAASIHVHIDGENGPTASDVSSAALRALYSLLEHVNGSQLGYIMQSSFDGLDEVQGWRHLSHCCWFSQKAAEWTQYQYRYAVPTWLVERLSDCQDAPETTELHQALTAMVATVFNSPVPLVNLSTSDIMSNLMALLVRRISIDPNDPLLPALIKCISSLGRHVYYSDQIHDLAAEIINRTSVLETQGVLPRSNPAYDSSRTQAIRCLLMGLVGLIHAADDGKLDNGGDTLSLTSAHGSTSPSTNKDAGILERPSRRTRVSPDVWHDTLSLLCDSEYAIRADYAETLMFYIAQEMPKHGDNADAEIVKRVRRLAEGPLPQAVDIQTVLHAGDLGVKFLHALHAYLYILATTRSLNTRDPSSTSSSSFTKSEGLPAVTVQPATPLREEHSIPDIPSQEPDRRSNYTGRSRKISMALRLLESSSRISTAVSACLSDYAHIQEILITVHEQFPVRGLMTGVPMLLSLDRACQSVDSDGTDTVVRMLTVKAIIARVWLTIGKVWEVTELVEFAEKALASMPSFITLPQLRPMEMGVYQPPQTPIMFSSTGGEEASWDGVEAEAALSAVVSNSSIQEATGLDQQGLVSRFSNKWSAESALENSVERPSAFEATLRGDGVSPLLKISPGLMHIENISLQSLARSTRGVGVTDLREALEGRSSMSNPALARPSSISTLDHASSIVGSDNRPIRSRMRTKKGPVPSGSGDVRDVLNKLGLGKQNGSLLKASFPALQSEQRLSSR